MSLAAVVFLGSLAAALVVLGLSLRQLVRAIRSFLRTVSDAAIRIEAAATNLAEPGAGPYTQAVPEAKDSS